MIYCVGFPVANSHDSTRHSQTFKMAGQMGQARRDFEKKMRNIEFTQST